MPELPEVETTVTALRPYLEGRTIVRATIGPKPLRTPWPAGLGQALTGARITRLWRRAKYGLLATDRDQTLIFHLGMAGRWLVDPAEPSPHDHLVLETEENRQLVLRDPRRFGQVAMVNAGTEANWPGIASLGPEPLDKGFDGPVLARAMARRKTTIKVALLDQRRVAGLGNIYVCEALAHAGIAPGRPAGSLSSDDYARLAHAIVKVLRKAIAAGGSSFSDYVHPSGELGNFARDWRVYGRAGQICACGGTVIRTLDAGRSTFWCSQCQR